MSEYFNIKNTLRRLNPTLTRRIFEIAGVPVDIDWEDSTIPYRKNIFSLYTGLDENDSSKIEPILTTIGMFATHKEAGELMTKMIKGEDIVLLPEYQDKTILDRSAWLFLNHPELWKKLE